MPPNIAQKTLILESVSQEGGSLRAEFLPDAGMNLISFKKDSIELIAKQTTPLFEQRFAGLGPVIGPHFHQRAAHLVFWPDETLFPHVVRAKQLNRRDPFSHGIARYAPWKVIQSSEKELTALLSGKDSWQGIPLSQLEGQNFEMAFTAKIGLQGLEISMSVVSDSDSLVGLHYYLNLPNGKKSISSFVSKKWFAQGNREPIPSELFNESTHAFTFSFDRAMDYAFHSFPDPLKGKVCLKTEQYAIEFSTQSQSQENCWQLYYPLNADFVCIEPISSQDPLHPNLTVSSLQVLISVSGTTL